MLPCYRVCREWTPHAPEVFMYNFGEDSNSMDAGPMFESRTRASATARGKRSEHASTPSGTCGSCRNHMR
jgi:hypothetical protein